VDPTPRPQPSLLDPHLHPQNSSQIYAYDISGIFKISGGGTPAKIPMNTNLSISWLTI